MMEEQDFFEDREASQQAGIVGKRKSVTFNIGKLMPAKDLLQAAHPKDEPIRIIMKKTSVKAVSDKAISSKVQSIKDKISGVFSPKDTLGYAYQEYFSQMNSKLVYSRHMMNYENWSELIKYGQPEGGVKYLGGLFVDPKNIEKQERRELREIYNNMYAYAKNYEQLNYCPLKIKFSACGPSQNLLYAFEIAERQYDLIIHNDTNSKGSTQWFNFSVIFPEIVDSDNSKSIRHLEQSPNSSSQKYKFNIINLTKGGYLFKKGMKVVYKTNYEEDDEQSKDKRVSFGEDIEKKNSGWARLSADQLCEFAVTDVEVEDSSCQGVQRRRRYQSLSFTYTHVQRYDYPQKVAFAYCFPYTVENEHQFWNQYVTVRENRVDLDLQKQAAKDRSLKSSSKSIGKSLKKVAEPKRHSKADYKVTEHIIGYSVSNLPIIAYSVELSKTKNNHDSLSKRNRMDATHPHTAKSSRKHAQSNIPSLRQRKLSGGFKQQEKVKSLVIMARQHPGETQGSFMIEGMMNWLLQTSGRQTKCNFIYHFIPMANVQGIILGNYRTNIMGYDINRGWRAGESSKLIASNESMFKQSHPEVVAIKQYLTQVNEQNPISLILDLHGHSKSLNSFFYGTEKGRWRENPKLFPYYCSKNIKQISYPQCSFRIGQSKKNTARAVLGQMFPKALVYTLENSFYGFVDKKSSGSTVISYTPDILKEMGKSLIKSYLQFSEMGSSAKYSEGKDEFVKEFQVFEKSAMQQGQLSQLGQTDQKCVSDSDSEACEDLIDRAQVFVEAKTSIQKEKIQSAPTQTPKQRNEGLRKNTPTGDMKNVQIPSMRAPLFSARKKNIEQKSGKYLKTIQMVDSSREEMTEQEYLHRYESQLIESSTSKQPERTHDYPKLTPPQSCYERGQQSKGHEHKLFTLTALKTNNPFRKKSPNCHNQRMSSSRQVHNLEKNSYQELNFINQKEFAYQKIKMRRLKGDQNGFAGANNILLPGGYLRAERLVKDKLQGQNQPQLSGSGSIKSRSKMTHQQIKMKSIADKSRRAKMVKFKKLL